MFAGLTVSVTSTLGTPLIPTIADDFGVSLATAQWMLTVTLLVGVVATPVLGRLGDGPLRSRILVGTLAAVAVGAAISATSHSMAQLLLGRSLMGIGFATVPLAISLAREHLKGSRQTSAIAALSITVAVGAGLGFPITGLIAEDLGFHAAFWFGTIFATGAMVTVLLTLPRERKAHRRVPMDYPGAILLGAGLAALLLALSEANRLGWGSTAIIGLFLLSALSLAAWFWVELRSDEPLIDLASMSNPSVLGANVAAVLLGIGLYIGMSLINILAQTPTESGYGFGASLVTAGLLLLPLSAGSLVSQPIARRLVDRIGVERTLPIGAVLVAATLFWLTVGHSQIWEIGLTTCLLGIGIGVTFATMPALIVSAVPAERTGSAIGLNQVLRTTGGSIGSALSAMIIASHTTDASPYPQASGFTEAFAAGVVICLIAAGVSYLLMHRGRLHEVDRAERDLLMEEGSAGGGVGPAVFDGEEMVST
ncbi:MAG: MFS transporter [Solirubrobacterales bacterium]|nr:MFS transporter [Solirubrobacterales bacterium]